MAAAGHHGRLASTRSLAASSAMLANPPVFDNPLRRRGCCDLNHAAEMRTYRAEAIERELSVKRALRQASLDTGVPCP